MSQPAAVITRTDPIRHVQKLSGELGPRPAGSPANQVAAEYIARFYTGCGLQVERQEWECPAWEELGVRLEVNGQALEAAANWYSPPCDVTAPLAPVGTLAELRAANLRGCIGVLHSDLTRAPLGVKAWPYKDERDIEVVRLLEEQQPAALLAVQWRKNGLERWITDAEFTIPSATVGMRAGLALLQAAGQSARLRIQSRQQPGTTCNVIARMEGKRPERILLCAHYDTMHDTPGAVDNAAGTAALLAAAERLSQKRPDCGLEFISLSGHETMPVGIYQWMERYEDSLDGLLAVINFDTPGHFLMPDTITVTSGSPAFTRLVSETAAPFHGITWTEPWVESDHSAFAFRGIPAVAIGAPACFHLTHLRSDTAEWISSEKLEAAAALAGRLVEALQRQAATWTRTGE